ncbi:MAG: LysM peptidoglycan-binding domain-containing protein [Bacteroidetes bacterium]|nr:LysM peptidoglycan-binding domain-containing protein [Bacteroidota bacterium]
MSLQEKYASVLALGEKLAVRNGKVEETDGVLRMWGLVNDPYEKNLLWDAIKSAGGDNPSDIAADIQVENTGYYTKHTVEKGESLSKIAKHYYDDMMKYKHIFDANRDILDDPDKIEIGQVLVIPNL